MRGQCLGNARDGRRFALRMSAVILRLPKTMETPPATRAVRGGARKRRALDAPARARHQRDSRCRKKKRCPTKNRKPVLHARLAFACTLGLCLLSGYIPIQPSEERHD